MAITNLYALRARLMAYGTSFHFRNWERLYASRGLRQSEISIQHLEKDEAETWTWHVSSPFRHWHYSCPVPPLYSPWMKARVDFLHLFSARLISNHLTLCTHSLPKRPHWTIRPRKKLCFEEACHKEKEVKSHVYPFLSKWFHMSIHFSVGLNGYHMVSLRLGPKSAPLDRSWIGQPFESSRTQEPHRKIRKENGTCDILWQLCTVHSENLWKSEIIGERNDHRISIQHHSTYSKPVLRFPNKNPLRLQLPREPKNFASKCVAFWSGCQGSMYNIYYYYNIYTISYTLLYNGNIGILY